jgi:ElaB/YqjD/DUF883 family membrane-anchored ribosome-binding protein
MQTSASTARSNRSSTAEFREKASEVAEGIRELGGVAKEAAAEKFDHWYKDGREKAVQLEKGFENQIREHPLQSVIIAAGVGFAAGYLISRRS